MRAYREYRGLFGEPVRVPEDTIMDAPYRHSSGAFPFLAIAKQLGERRDAFAYMAGQRTWIEEVERLPQVKRMLAA